MTQTNQEEHKDLRTFVKVATSTYETEDTSAAAADAFRCRFCEIKPDASFAVQYDDHIGSLTKAGTIQLPINVDFRVGGLLRAASAAGTEADLAPFWSTGIFYNTALSPSANKTSANGTTSLLSVSAGGSTSNGDVIGLYSGGRLYPRIVESAGASAHLISPALPGLPGSGTSCTVSKTYRLESACNEKAAVMWKFGTHSMQKLTGAVVQSYKFMCDGGAPKYEFSGKGRVYRQAASTLLSGALTSGATSAFFQTPDRVTNGVQLDIYSGSTVVETVTVTDKYSNVFTIGRGSAGTTADAHADSAVVKPHVPTQTLRGKAIPPSKCTVTVGYAATSSTVLEAQNIDLTVEGGLSMHERQAGDEWVNYGFSLQDTLAINLTAGGIMDKERWADWRRAGGDGNAANAANEYPTMIQFGDQKGQVFGAFIGRLRPGVPDPETEGDAQVGVNITGQGMGKLTRSAGSALPDVVFFTM